MSTERANLGHARAGRQPPVSAPHGEAYFPALCAEDFPPGRPRRPVAPSRAPCLSRAPRSSRVPRALPAPPPPAPRAAAAPRATLVAALAALAAAAARPLAAQGADSTTVPVLFSVSGAASLGTYQSGVTWAVVRFLQLANGDSTLRPSAHRALRYRLGAIS